jgi:hypothetical protein
MKSGTDRMLTGDPVPGASRSSPSKDVDHLTFAHSPAVSGWDRNAVDISIAQVSAARLDRAMEEGHWRLAPWAPFAFEPIRFEADDQEQAIRIATTWLRGILHERGDLSSLFGDR